MIIPAKILSPLYFFFVFLGLWFVILVTCCGIAVGTHLVPHLSQNIISCGSVFLQEGQIFSVETAGKRLPQCPQKSDVSGLFVPQLLHIFIYLFYPSPVPSFGTVYYIFRPPKLLRQNRSAFARRRGYGLLLQLGALTCRHCANVCV